jgi:hypothetical protein
MSFPKFAQTITAIAFGVVYCCVVSTFSFGQNASTDLLQNSGLAPIEDIAPLSGVPRSEPFARVVDDAAPITIESVMAGYPSAPKAFALSMILPGLGHRYVEGGKWSGWASTFAVADAGLWMSLLGSNWKRGQLIESYTTLAALNANADIEGKDRSFFLNLASYRSSQNFLDTALRNRAWNQVDYVTDPSYQWIWNSEDNFVKYRDLREDAESLRRRRVVIVASLVANRIISGVMAAWKATRIKTAGMSLQLTTPPRNSSLPVAKLKLRF